MPKGVPLTYNERRRRDADRKAARAKRLRDRQKLTWAAIGERLGVTKARAFQLYQRQDAR